MARAETEGGGVREKLLRGRWARITSGTARLAARRWLTGEHVQASRAYVALSVADVMPLRALADARGTCTSFHLAAARSWPIGTRAIPLPRAPARAPCDK